MARRFNTRQRVALYIQSQGMCANPECGAELAPGWHADHQQAWARGGRTDVLNGQALCPTCNQRKGVGMNPWPQSVALRPWQIRAIEKFDALNQQNFFAEATPGAGKTVLALRLAHRELVKRSIERLVIVCPTEHLKTQWASEAHKVGISLQPDYINNERPEAADFHGVAITYHQVQAWPDIHRMYCQRPTMVIFDEIHHAGESQAWGDALRHAFDPAVRRLMLSGTPFRTDNNVIPYLQYATDGHSKPDFRYGYADGLSDRVVVRAMFFPSFEGSMDWSSGGKRFINRFEDDLSLKRSAERLRTALATMGGSDWLTTVIGEADRKITSIRQDGHADAGGLVIAIDQYHAGRIADLLSRVTGEVPTVAISDNPDSSEHIKAFAKGTGRWIVAVRMVSEGVDIPRLRVGVYATTTVTEMFFRQAVGRFVRWQPGLEDQTAYLYIPRHPELLKFAEEIKKERDHELEELIELIAKERVSGNDSGNEQTYCPIDSEAFADAWISPEGGPLSVTELQQAAVIKLRLGLKDTPENLARAFRDAAGLAPPAHAVTGDESLPELNIRKKHLRTACKRLVGKIANVTGVEPADINLRQKQISGKRIGDETESELNERLGRLMQWLDEAKHGSEPAA